MDTLLSYFQKFVALSPDAEAAIRAGFAHRVCGRGELLLRPGEVASHAYFIETGALRVYADVNAEEIVMWLGLPNSMVVSLVSFINRTPSAEYVQALAPTTLWCVAHDTLQTLYRTHADAERLGRLLMEQYAIQQRQHSFSLRCQTTTQRYNTLLRQQPDLFQHVRLSDIASFLGMTPQALSMARARRE